MQNMNDKERRADVDAPDLGGGIAKPGGLGGLQPYELGGLGGLPTYDDGVLFLH